MRKIYFLLTFFFFAGLSFAQDQVQVTLSQPPPNQLRATDLWKAILINTTKSTLHITLSGTLEVKGEGIVVDGKSRLMSLPPGTKMITYNDVKTGNVNFKPGKWSEAFNRTGNAPSGDYTICIVVKAEDGREIGSSCIDQTIAAIIPEEVSPHLTVKLISPPPNQLKTTNLWKIVATNASAVAYKAFLITVELKENTTGIQAESKLSSVMISGSKSFSFSDFNLAGITYRNTKLQEAYGKNMNAPDGNYTICVSVKNEGGEEVAGDCIDQTIETLIPEEVSPQLISPANGSKLNLNQPILFTWMLPSIKPGADINYKMKVVEILGNQSPSEAVNRNPAWFEKNDIRTTIFQYPVSAKKIEKNKKYAWTVQLINREEQGVAENSGKSEAFMFDVEGENGVTKSLPITNPTDSTSSVGGTGTAAVGDTIKAGYNGEFKVIVTDATTEADSSITGKGRVHINWLGTNVAVEFKKIRVDTTKRLTSGGIVTTESGSSSTSYLAYPLAWAQSVLTGPGAAHVVDNMVHWTNHQVDNLVNWVNGLNYGQPQINYQSNIPPLVLPDYSLKMPFGLQFNNGNQKLVITEMVFKKDSSKINFLAQEKFTKSGTTYTLGFAGKYFPIHPSSINFSSGRVELVEDIKIPNTSSNPKMKFNFKKGTANSGCYVVWDSTGVKDISLALDVKFTRDWLLPIPTSTDSVTATISGNGTSMHDILLTGSLPHCEIVGTNGFKVLADSISLDLSDSRNPGSIHFPKNYSPDSTVTWQGFYIKSFGLTLPDTWKTGANLHPPIVTASNIIIDDMGLTAKIKAVNVFDLQSGRVADLSASLDTVEVSIISSSLVSGTAKGILVLPISEVIPQNSLKYTATFAQVASVNSFQIVIVPLGPIDADIFKGKMTLNPTSNISAMISPNSKTLSINLNGFFKWDNPTPGIKGLKMELGFENVGLTYTNNSTTNTLAFNPGTWSFASPPKWLANFPVSIKNIYYKSLSTLTPADPNMKELLRGALMMDIVVNLTETIGGSTTLGAAFTVEFDNGNKKFHPKFKNVFLDSLSVHADLPAVKIDGYLKLFENVPKFGDGFQAGLGVTFTAVSLSVNALVQFGSTTYLNNNQYYRYWKVEADAKFSPGIPFLTGVGFYGFGGGAYYNMKAKPKISPTVVPGAFTFEPQKGFKGLKVSTTIGTLPKVDTFNADISLTAQFNPSNGLDLIIFTGNFWLAAKLTDRPNSKLYGGVNIDYDFPTKIFNLNGSLTIAVAPSISTPAGNPVAVHLYINGHSNKWYFKCGVPTNPNTVDVFGLNLYSYLMFGNDLGTDVPNGFTPDFASRYLAVNGSYPSFAANVGTGGAGNETATGKGFAFGVGVQFSKSVSENLVTGTCRKWSFNADVAAGAELNLALLEYNNCGSFNPFGINGYRASGSLGLYGKVTATINGNNYKYVAGYAVCSDKLYNLFDVRIGAWVTGSFPNPVYVAGRIQTTISLFGDAVDIAFTKDFEYGTNCISTAITTANAPAGDEADSLRNKLIQYVSTTSYNFPVASPINVKYSLVPNMVFDVAENQPNGEIKNRTFKLIVTQKLEVKENGVWVAKTLQSKINNLGEWQYFIKAPLTGVVTQGNSQLATTATVNSINSNNGNTLMAQNGLFTVAKITFPIPPPPAPNYPNPIPDPVNNLVADKDYRFTVTAALKELSGTSWSTAKTRTGIDVIETKIKLFRTGGMQLVQVNTTAPKSK